MCVAGGWIGGSIKDKEIFSSLDQMNSMNVKTALLSILKLKRLSFGFEIPGRKRTFSIYWCCPSIQRTVFFLYRTPGMLAYGLSKTATHAISLNAALR